MLQTTSEQSFTAGQDVRTPEVGHMSSTSADITSILPAGKKPHLVAISNP